MKWNAISVSAACIFIGLGGVILGKITSGKTELSEQDRLLEASERLIQQRSVDGGTDFRARETTRPNRPSQELSGSNIDRKLANMEEIVRGENALTRGRAMLNWIDSLAPQEFEAAVDRFRSLGLTEARMGEYAMLLTAWSEVDPSSALAYTTENTNGMATGTVLSAWASRDPESAIAWAKSNHQGEDANPYMAGIIRGIVSSDPIRATALLQELPFSVVRAEALDAMTPYLLKIGADAAKKWVAELSDERLRGGATSRLAEALAKQDPAGTASWLLENINERTVTSVDDVFREWAKEDPAGALANFESLPEGEARSRALRGIVTQDARNNPQAAADLMNRFPKDITDRTVQHFIWNSYEKAPDVAANQIGLIQDERSRNRMYERALSSWLDRDKAAAKNWISSANLPASVIEALGASLAQP
ncbi:MAG: hypothetical protein ACK47H_10730 [Akkermansiaceae bacterium]